MVVPVPFPCLRSFHDYKSEVVHPWYVLEERDFFPLSRFWRLGELPPTALVFARRQEADTLAVFIRPELNSEVAEIMGWTPEGYSVLARFPNFEDWLADLMRRGNFKPQQLTR